MHTDAFVLGAVAYDPKVVTIWDGFQVWFERQGFPFDYVLFTNYEQQVEAHFSGILDAAWNSPLAWLQAEAFASRRGMRTEAIAMRDSDCDLTSVLVVRADSQIQSLEDLKGRVVGVGAGDSPQATLIPLEHFASRGLVPDRDFRVRRFDLLVGKHGDHVGGEFEAALALARGEVDAACLLDANYLALGRDGRFAPGAFRVLDRTGLFDHCNFTVLSHADASKIARFRELLFSMKYEDPAVRALMDLEGLKAWRPGRTSGYRLLATACERFDTLRTFLARAGEKK